MGRSVRKAAYVVFHGHIPGVYDTWEECNEQVHRFPGGRQRGYDSRSLAEDAWEQHQSPLPKRKFLAEIDPSQAINTDYPRSAKRARIAAMEQATQKHTGPPRMVIEISDDEEGEHKPAQKKHKVSAQVPEKEVDCVTLLDGLDEKPIREKYMVTAETFAKQADFISLDDDESEERKPIPKGSGEEEKPIVLTAAQQVCELRRLLFGTSNKAKANSLFFEGRGQPGRGRT